MIVAPWDSMAEPEPEPLRGSNAVLHSSPRGRRSKKFPDLNITATAQRLGITKSHLAKILTGKHKPSLALAQKIADALGETLEFVAALSKTK